MLLLLILLLIPLILDQHNLFIFLLINILLKATCGGLIIVAGIISSIFFGILVDKTRKYRLFYRITGGISTVSLGLLIGSMYTYKPIWLYLAAFLYGFGSMSLMPITFEFGCE